MFEAAKELLKKMQSFDQSKTMDEIMTDKQMDAKIIDLNQNQLYEQGLNADGTETGQYAPITVNYYKPLAASEGRDGRTDHITGKDTGATYKSMTVVAESEGVSVAAENNGFFDRLPDALGLTDESKQEILPDIQSEFLNAFKKAIS